MAQTFYIEADEEIISVVGRLRHTNDVEIALVVPKHAILMQSIVSLKLLEREAKKIGKIIMIVSQDDNGRALAEKAGLQSRSYQEEQIRHEEELAEIDNKIKSEEVVAVSPPKDSYGVKAESIGSESFFNPNHTVPSNPIAKISGVSEAVEKPKSSLRVMVRDKSPNYQTALNSKNPIQPSKIPAFAPSTTETPLQRKAYPEPIQQKKFLSPRMSSVSTPSASAPHPVIVHSRVKIAIACAGIAVLFLIGSAAFFLFAPKAVVTIFPGYMEEKDSFELRLIHASNNLTEEGSDNQATLEVPYRLVEESIDVPLSIAPTGVGSGGERKARGKVIIYNEFGSESQPLVSTTRLETANGFIFRLTQGVTVPGMTEIGGKKEPGAIEAEVIADQAGDTFNITPTTFTIPGFKGSAKYSKFSAKSLVTMTGGSKNGTSGDLFLSREDIDRTKNQAKDRAMEVFRQKISETLTDGEKIDDNGIEILTLSEEPLLHEGLSGASIDVTFHYKIKAYIVSENAIERAILRAKSATGKLTTSAGLSFVPKTVTIDTIEIIPDFQSGGGKLKVTASLLLMTEIKTDAIREELLGKHSDELRGVLDRHPEIVKMNLDVEPRFFIEYIPKNSERLTIVIADPGQE